MTFPNFESWLDPMEYEHDDAILIIMAQLGLDEGEAELYYQIALGNLTGDVLDPEEPKGLESHASGFPKKDPARLSDEDTEE